MLLQCGIERVESVVWLSQRQPGPAVRCPARGRGHPGRGLREPLSSQLLDAVIDVSLSAHRWAGGRAPPKCAGGLYRAGGVSPGRLPDPPRARTDQRRARGGQRWEGAGVRPVRLLAEDARAARLNDSLRAIDAALRRLTPDAGCVYTRASGLPRLSRQRPRPAFG